MERGFGLFLVCCTTEINCWKTVQMPLIWDHWGLMGHHCNVTPFENTKSLLSACRSVRWSCECGSNRAMEQINEATMWNAYASYSLRKYIHDEIHFCLNMELINNNTYKLYAISSIKKLFETQKMLDSNRVCCESLLCRGQHPYKNRKTHCCVRWIRHDTTAIDLPQSAATRDCIIFM